MYFDRLVSLVIRPNSLKCRSTLLLSMLDNFWKLSVYFAKATSYKQLLAVHFYSLVRVALSIDV